LRSQTTSSRRSGGTADRRRPPTKGPAEGRRCVVAVEAFAAQRAASAPAPALDPVGALAPDPVQADGPAGLALAPTPRPAPARRPAASLLWPSPGLDPSNTLHLQPRGPVPAPSPLPAAPLPPETLGKGLTPEARRRRSQCPDLNHPMRGRRPTALTVTRVLKIN